MNYSVEITKDSKAKFNNKTTYCVGTGRMGLALHKEYFDQLKYVQDNIGFSFIRGHGLFCDDMGIYQEFYDRTGLKTPNEFKNFGEYWEYVKQNAKKEIEYNFTYLDRVVDSYLSVNIRPFLELGFMPKNMASGEQTVFYWKGNVTPPKDYDTWCNLVVATLKHLIERYGEEEVLGWPVEVWNEPNLTTFWKGADMDEYFVLYEKTVKAIKAFNPKIKVGGPAICGGADEKWMVGFLKHVNEKKLPLDFISRHHYTTEFPEHKGHYGYAKMMKSDDTFATLENCRNIIEAYPEYKDIPFYITEFNTSYIPNCPVHDTNENAAYIARTLSKIGDYCSGYSYWTFGDVFEEGGIPFTPFHGGFGLLANGLIPKPTFYTFKFFKDLGDAECVYRDKNLLVLKTADGLYKGIAWNLTIETNEDNMKIEIALPVNKKRLCLLTKTVDEECCNPLKIWHDLGEKANPDAEQVQLLKDCAKPLVKSLLMENNDENDGIILNLSLKRNAVQYFELKEAELTSDRGYDYSVYEKGF